MNRYVCVCVYVCLPVHPIHGFKYYELLATNRKKLCKSESFRYVTTNWLRICIVCGLVSLNCPMSHRRTLNSDYENLARTSLPTTSVQQPTYFSQQQPNWLYHRSFQSLFYWCMRYVIHIHISAFFSFVHSFMYSVQVSSRKQS